MKRVKILLITLALTFGVNGVADSNKIPELAAPDRETINEAANRGRQSQNMGQMLNMMAAAGLFASCFASTPPNMALCAMGALAAAQGAAQGQAAGMSDLAFDASEYKPGDYGNNNGLKPSSEGNGKAGFDNPIVKKGMEHLTESGYKVGPDGVTFPDGSFKSGSDFTSANSMMAAGIDEASAKAAEAALNEINDRIGKSGANVVAMGVNSGSGGGYSDSGSADFGDLGDFSLPKMQNPFANPNEKKILAGKSVMVGGEPIGVKGDNIFDMVHRAYQKKRTKRQFFESSATPRLPASMTKKGGL